MWLPNVKAMTRKDCCRVLSQVSAVQLAREPLPKRYSTNVSSPRPTNLDVGESQTAGDQRAESPDNKRRGLDCIHRSR